MDKKVRWFIQPLDDSTNRSIAAMNSLTPENFVEEKDGIKNLWWCESYACVTSLNKASKSLKFRFKVYRAAGNGKLQEWKFLRKKKKHK